MSHAISARGSAGRCVINLLPARLVSQPVMSIWDMDPMQPAGSLNAGQRKNTDQLPPRKVHVEARRRNQCRPVLNRLPLSCHAVGTRTHPDGSGCLEGVQRVPPGFDSCCAWFEARTFACEFDIRVECRARDWVICVPDGGSSGLVIQFCPSCGTPLDSPEAHTGPS